MTPLVSPETCVGVSLSVVVLSPSSPTLLLPQHFTAPEVSNAHEWLLPVEIAAWLDAFGSSTAVSFASAETEYGRTKNSAASINTTTTRPNLR